MKLKPYPEYKDSGVEWIGKIPEDWEIKRLKHFTENLDGKRIPISAEQRISGSIPYYGSTGVVDYVDDFIFDEELLLIGEDGAPFFDPYKEVSFIIEGKSWVNNHAHVLRVLEGINIKILMHQLNQTDYAYFIKGSTRDKLNQDYLKEIPIIEPPEDVQSRIIFYLNKKTSEIDLIIEKETQLIELLKEKRTALINHVVINGLDPKVKMKDSVVEWISEIPEDWEIYRVRHLLENGIEGIKIGPFGSMIKSDEIITHGYKVYGQENVINLDFNRGTRYLTGTKFKQLIKYQLFPEDLVITMMGTTGKAQIVPDSIQEGIMDSHLIRLRFNEKVIPKFMEILINSSDYVSGEITYFGKGAIMQGLNSGIIKNLILAIPPFHEQEKILNYLDIEISKTNLTIQKIQKNIELLEEYKKSLIHHVITGKVDVREVAL